MSQLQTFFQVLKTRFQAIGISKAFDANKALKASKVLKALRVVYGCVVWRVCGCGLEGVW